MVKNKKLECSCVCKCFGYFKHQDWPVTIIPENIEIQILFRERIRVFFKNAQEAEEAGYIDYDTTRDKDGYVFAFTGLRGDAKQLYQDIKRGRETRVKLI
jgi:hypothetical protein